jgi:DNA-binding XRE family transcriptional regulator
VDFVCGQVVHVSLFHAACANAGTYRRHAFNDNYSCHEGHSEGVTVLPGYAHAVREPEADMVTAVRREAVGSRMRDLRKRAGLTQAQVAAAARLSRYFYREVEAGRRTLSLDNVFAIAAALGTDPRDLFTDLPAVGQDGSPRIPPS